MNIKPSLKRDKESGVWTASYTSEFGQEFKTKGHSAGEAMQSWYKTFGKKFGIIKGGG
jgi:hypothetical protein